MRIRSFSELCLKRSIICTGTIVSGVTEQYPYWYCYLIGLIQVAAPDIFPTLIGDYQITDKYQRAASASVRK